MRADRIEPGLRKEESRKYYLKNRERQIVRAQAWYRTHKARVQAAGRLRLYGLTQERYDALLAAQGGACAICLRVRPLHVDHDHDLGIVRGLLCGPCNVGIGMLKDGELFAAAGRYLRGDNSRSS